MVTLNMTDGSVLYTRESYSQVERWIRSGKSGGMEGFLDAEGTKPIFINISNIVYVTK